MSGEMLLDIVCCMDLFFACTDNESVLR